MPIIRPRRNHETNQIDYGYDDAIENEINSKPTFATKKKGKFLTSLKERLSSDKPYDKLSEEDKQKYNYLAGQAKYTNYLGFGCLGIAAATAIFNGQAIMGADFLNFSYGITDNIALTLAESLEYTFFHIPETLARFALVFAPAYKAVSFALKSDAYSSQASELLGAHKESITEKFVNKMASRYANAKALKESGAVINPYIDEPEEAPVNDYPCEEVENINFK